MLPQSSNDAHRSVTLGAMVPPNDSLQQGP